MHRRWTSATLTAIVLTLAPVACRSTTYDPSRATHPYPKHLHLTDLPGPDGEIVQRPFVVDVQVFRSGSKLTIINTTAQSYEDVDVWINQRYLYRVDAIPAGEKVELSLFEFVDELGEIFSGGGLLRTTAPQPVRMVELQLDDERPLVGLIAIPEGRDH